MANTIREKELKTDWDATTASDSTKAVGHAQTLIATNGSFVPKRKKAGMSD